MPRLLLLTFVLSTGCPQPTPCDTDDTDLPADTDVTCLDPDGNEVPPGTSWPDVDECNTCACQTDGDVHCTDKACLPPSTG